MVNLTTLPARQIVTGQSGAGKTTYCQQILAAARAAGWTPGGMLSPPRFEQNQKTGILALNLRSGEQRLLASCVPGELTGLRFGQWTFDPEVLAWGNDIFAAACDCDLLIVDEIGPMEFDLQHGWPASLQAITQPEPRIILVTVRPACLPRLQQQPGWAAADVLQLPDATDAIASSNGIGLDVTKEP